MKNVFLKSTLVLALLAILITITLNVLASDENVFIKTIPDISDNTEYIGSKAAQDTIMTVLIATSIILILNLVIGIRNDKSETGKIKKWKTVIYIFVIVILLIFIYWISTTLGVYEFTAEATNRANRETIKYSSIGISAVLTMNFLIRSFVRKNKYGAPGLGTTLIFLVPIVVLIFLAIVIKV